MDPRIAQIVAREMPTAIIVFPEVAPEPLAESVPVLESERLLRKKYGSKAVTPVSQDPTAMVVVEYPSGRRETLVIDLPTQTVIATSG